MHTLITLSRWIHIAAALIAVATFAIPLVTRKGGKLHRRVGTAFVGAMYTAAGTSFVSIFLHAVAGTLPKYFVFLGFVAWLAFSSAFYGVRVLQQKGRSAAHLHPLDLGVQAVLIVGALALIGFGVRADYPLAIYFAPVGIIIGLQRTRVLLGKPRSKHFWWFEHMDGMIGACIATLTAALVTNLNRLGIESAKLLVWLAPTMIGVPGLAVWQWYHRRRFARMDTAAAAKTSERGLG